MTGTILVADIGGTNARFALGKQSADEIRIDQVHRFRAEDYESLRDVADAYLETVRIKPDGVCLAVAGPVDSNIVEFTNSPWVLDIPQISAALDVKEFSVVNDFHALAAGVCVLPDDGFTEVKQGNARTGAPQLVIGPGTGLGQAIIVPAETTPTVISTEGGHVAFAPLDEREMEVLRFIQREHARVSVERLLSGRGLVNIHRALCFISDVPRASLQADEITAAAISREYPVAVEAVDLFCGILGSVAGDAVLASGAQGGVSLGGGILPKIREIFLNSDFEKRFMNKGRMAAYLQDVPVKLVEQEGAALYGAVAIQQGHVV